MTLRSLLTTIVFTLGFFTAQAQHNKPLSAQQKTADSIAFEKFKKAYPEAFDHKRLPTKLLDGTYAVDGYTTSIQLKGNRITDSVYHNFNPGMPDTSTVDPYNDIKVSAGKITINFFVHRLIGGPGTFDNYVTPVDKSKVKNNKVDGVSANIQPINFSARISINGKLIFDWKRVQSFEGNIYKLGNKWQSAASKDTGSMYGYTTGWAICDTSIQVGDQLLIEIKNDKNGWMVDRYNITRTAVYPMALSIMAANKNMIASLIGNDATKKKISRLPLPMKK